MNASPAFVTELIELVGEMAWFFDVCCDSVVAPDDAVRQMEFIAQVPRRQSEQDRQTVLAVVADLAAQQTQPGTREFLEDFPRLMGLVRSDDD